MTTYLDLYLQRILVLTNKKEDYNSIAKALLRQINQIKAPTKSFWNLVFTNPDQELYKLEEDLLNFSLPMTPLELFLRDQKTLPESFDFPSPLLGKILGLKIAQLDLSDFGTNLKIDLAEEIFEGIVTWQKVQDDPSYTLKLKILLDSGYLEGDGPFLDEIEENNPSLALFYSSASDKVGDFNYSQALLPVELFKKLYKEVTIEDLAITNSHFTNNIIFLKKIEGLPLPKSEFLACTYINNREIFWAYFDDFYKDYPAPYRLPEIYKNQKELEEALTILFQVVANHISLKEFEEIITNLKLKRFFPFPWQEGSLIHPIFYLEDEEKIIEWLRSEPKLLLTLDGNNLAISHLLFQEKIKQKEFLINLFHQARLWTYLEKNHLLVETPFALAAKGKAHLLDSWIQADARADSILLTREIFLEKDKSFLSFYPFIMKVLPSFDYWSSLSNDQKKFAPANLAEQLYDLLYEGDLLSINAQYYLYNIAIFYQGKSLPTKLFGKLLDDYLVLLALNKDQANLFSHSLFHLLEESNLISLEQLDLKKLFNMHQFDLFVAMTKSFFKFHQRALAQFEIADYSPILAKILPLALEAFYKVNYNNDKEALLHFGCFLHEEWGQKLTRRQLVEYKISINEISFDVKKHYIFFDGDMPIPLTKSLDKLAYEVFFLNKAHQLSSANLIAYYNASLLTMNSLLLNKDCKIFSIRGTIDLLLLDIKNSLQSSRKKENLLIELLKKPEVADDLQSVISPLWEKLQLFPYNFLQRLLPELNLKDFLHKAVVTRAMRASVIMNDEASVMLWLQNYYKSDKDFVISGLEAAVTTLNDKLIDAILQLFPTILISKKNYFFITANDFLPIHQNFFLILKSLSVNEKNHERIAAVAAKLLDAGYPRYLIEEASNKGIKDFAKELASNHLVRVIRNGLLNYCNVNSSLLNILDIINLVKKTGQFVSEKPVLIPLSIKYKNTDPNLAKMNLFLFQEERPPAIRSHEQLFINPLQANLINQYLDDNLKGKIQAVLLAATSLALPDGGLQLVTVIPAMIQNLLQLGEISLNLTTVAIPILVFVELGSYLTRRKDDNLTYKKITALAGTKGQTSWTGFVEEKKYLEYFYRIHPALKPEKVELLVKKFYFTKPALLMKKLLDKNNSSQKGRDLQELYHIINLSIIENNYLKAKKFFEEKKQLQGGEEIYAIANRKELNNLIWAYINGKIEQPQRIMNDSQLVKQEILNEESIEVLAQFKPLKTLDYILEREPLYIYILGGGVPPQLEDMMKQDDFIKVILNVRQLEEEMVI